MPASLKSFIYFGLSSVLMKALAVIGDSVGRFVAAPDLVTFGRKFQPQPIQKSITGLWLTANHQVCTEILKSPNWLSRPLAEKLYQGPGKYDSETIHPFLDSIIALDGPNQRRIKRVMHTAFTPDLMQSWKASSDSVVKKLIQDVTRGSEFDFVQAFARPLPLEIICEIIGVPLEYKEKCSQWGRVLGGIGLDLPKSNKELIQLEEASIDLTSLIEELLEQRRLQPKNDLISILANTDSDGERLTDKEIIASASFTLIAGFETTMNLLSVGTLALLENPIQLEELARNPELVPNFDEEALRLSSPIQFVVRTADSNQVLSDGTEVKKGQTIILNLSGANRDPKLFSNPDEFNIHRENARKNVSFGFGAHHCIGSQLARVEAEALWRTLFTAFPDTASWKLAGEPIYRNTKLIRSLDQLPMRF